jgi:hypothetical protein
MEDIRVAKEEDTNAVSPEAVWLPGIETAVAAAAGKVFGDFFAKGTDTVLSHLRHEGPITHRVLASWLMDGCYCAALEFYNLTVHGAYLEDMWVTEPEKNIDCDLSNIDHDYIIGGTVRSWKRPKAYLPVYIPPLKNVGLVLRLKDDHAKTLSKASVAGMRYAFTISGGKDVDAAPGKTEKAAKVRLRASGPIFRR